MVSPSDGENGAEMETLAFSMTVRLRASFSEVA